ncbi:MAG: M1 family metallopeptidase [Melioribacter sp.]|nr:M1 family metallopeptidase [Melioribacter sp.]
MKKIFLFTFFVLFTGILYFYENNLQSNQKLTLQDTSYYFKGILKSELDKINCIANYNIEVELISSQHLIYVKEKIIWINKTNFSTNELYFHLYANAYKSNNTLFAKAFYLRPENQTELLIKKFNVNGKTYRLIYCQPEIQNPNDSTVAKIILDKQINPGDSVKVYCEYSLKIPVSIKRFGRAAGRNFYFISQWFPKIGVFENGKWICSQYHPYLNFYSDFGEYNVKIKVPNKYLIASTGVIYKKENVENSIIYYITQIGVHDFAWMASDEILFYQDVFRRKDGTLVNILSYVQPEKKKYLNRYVQCIKNSLKYFEDYVGIYPYQNITLVDVPFTSASGGMEYPTLFTVSANLFSPIKTGWPEYLVVHEFAHQYFYGIIANNEVYEAWLDEGLTSYIATKIMYKYYPEILEHFKVISFVPVFGLNFLSYNGIPIIYTLAELRIPEGGTSIENYYRSLTIGSIADTSYKHPNRLSYIVNSYDKPELMLLSLERYIGFDKMMKILKNYYEKYKYKHPKSVDFINEVKNNHHENMDWFFDNLFYDARVFDYKISLVKKISSNEYEVIAERLGDGIFKNEIALYTNKDTLIQNWDGKERWKSFYFKTTDEVIAAEIDPKRKNLLDINFANNSYTLKPRYWASISIALRWFFWVQNALMILGSIG